MRPSEPVTRAAKEVHQDTAARRRARSAFYVGMSGTMLLIVLIGFTPTLYLRPFFNAPDYPAYILLHGVVLTAWYVGSFLQTVLVSAHRTDIHRRAGWVGAGLGVAVVAVGLMVVLWKVPRLQALGIDIEGGIAILSITEWSDLTSLLFFCVFLAMAVALRRRPEMHKRLMLLASISLIQPAVARISRWSLFAALVGPGVLSFSVMLLLLLAIALYDAISSKRIHPVTFVGGSTLFGSKLLSLVVARSEFGLSFIRGLG